MKMVSLVELRHYRIMDKALAMRAYQVSFVVIGIILQVKNLAPICILSNFCLYFMCILCNKKTHLTVGFFMKRLRLHHSHATQAAHATHASSTTGCIRRIFLLRKFSDNAVCNDHHTSDRCSIC